VTTANEALALLPNTKGCVVILSGGMDSTITMRLAVEKYGKENVSALTFFYGQKQKREIEMAKISTNMLGVKHKVVDASFLGEISKGFSANVDTDIAMPTIKDVLGDPRPKTYVPNRNMILMAIAAAYAETQNVDTILCGLQVHDEYGYHDTTQRWVDKVNDLLSENRIIKIKLVAPFSKLSKYDELSILRELDGNMDLTLFTLTCYNPNEEGESCGACPSCSERIANFAKVGIKDPVQYSVNIDWKQLIERMKV
jgi:7-cyano-7-deazaguanine synthase